MVQDNRGTKTGGGKNTQLLKIPHKNSFSSTDWHRYLADLSFWKPQHSVLFSKCVSSGRQQQLALFCYAKLKEKKKENKVDG